MKIKQIIFFCIFIIFTTVYAEYISMDFDNVNIKQLIKTVSEILHKNFIIDPRVRGNVTILSPKKVHHSKLLPILENLLESNGFTLSYEKGFIKVIPLAEVSKTQIPFVGKYKDDISSKEQNFVTTILQIEKNNINDVVNIINNLKSPYARVVTIPNSNIIMLKEKIDNIKYIMNIVKQIESKESEFNIYTIQIENVMVSYIISKVSAVINDERILERDPGNKPAYKIIQDEQHNSVILITSEDNYKFIYKLIKKFDVVDSIKPDYRVYHVEYVNPATLISQLKQLYQLGIPRWSDKSFINQEVLLFADNARKLLILVTKHKRFFDLTAKYIDSVDTQLIKDEKEVGIHIYKVKHKRAEKIFPIVNGIPIVKIIDPNTTEKKLTLQMFQDQISNSLIVISNTKEFELLKNIIETMDVPVRQIFIDVLIIEVSLKSEFNFGVEWVAGEQLSKITGGNGLTGDEVIASGGLFGENAGQIPPTGFSLGYLTGKKFKDIPVYGLIKASKGKSDLNILSNPQILTLENEEATVMVGDQEPFPVSERVLDNGQLVRSYEYRDIGINLKIKPFINNNIITMKLNQEVNKASLGEQGAPTVSKRQISTNVAIPDKRTVVIGGLMQTNDDYKEVGIPLLSSIPFIGNLFKHQEKITRKTNLFIFITPYILEGMESMSNLTQSKKNELNTKLDDRKELEEYHEKLESIE